MLHVERESGQRSRSAPRAQSRWPESLFGFKNLRRRGGAAWSESTEFSGDLTQNQRKISVIA
jgi:hypothetical protein